jgi:hypothetical protein
LKQSEIALHIPLLKEKHTEKLHIGFLSRSFLLQFVAVNLSVPIAIINIILDPFFSFEQQEEDKTKQNKAKPNHSTALKNRPRGF